MARFDRHDGLEVLAPRGQTRHPGRARAARKDVILAIQQQHLGSSLRRPLGDDPSAQFPARANSICKGNCRTSGVTLDGASSSYPIACTRTCRPRS
ncbi:MAG: hypothetical protein R3F17_07245 [Planctomycetota bacterium]